MMKSLAALALAACSSTHGVSSHDAAADAVSDGPVHHDPPHLGASREVCKLLSNRNTSDPTANDVQHRANMLGADLGIPVDAAGTLYIFFGDTIGFKAIWGNESHPDAVGRAADPTSAVIADPSLLCSDLEIQTLAPSASIGPTVDPSIAADFAAGSMAAPAGHTLGEYVHNPAGPADHTFANLPGDFEVPSGAFAYGGAVYVFYTTVVSRGDITMKGSYLAKWATPRPANMPNYEVQYAIDERFDAQGPLGGNFVNISAAVAGDYVYLLGSGAYRASSIHLARKALATLATPGGFEVYDPATSAWRPPGSAAAPLFGPDGFGETSVRYLPEVGRWMFLAEELLPATNHIIARFADAPEGPWSDAIVVHDMADPAFRGAYCCAVDNQCDGKQFFNCDRTGFYGSYLLPGVQAHGDGSFTASYTLSSFDPYNVAVFQADFTP